MRTPEELLRAFASECLMVEANGDPPRRVVAGGIALIDSGWIDVSDEEMAYLSALCDAD